MKTCKKCGRQIADDNIFCEWCGTRVKPDPNPTSPRWMVWLLVSVIFLAGAAIVANVIDHRKKEEERKRREKMAIEDLKTTYDKAIENFDFQSGNIVVDKDGNLGVQVWVIDALKSLQTIEESENKPLFAKTEIEPCYSEKRALYREKLIESKNNINEKYKGDLDSGVSNPYINELRARLRLIEDILEQTSGNSVLDVQLPVPQKKGNEK